MAAGLPLIKPPWGRITAIDMNKGEHLWQMASGPTPKAIAEHPALKGLDIPPTGTRDAARHARDEDAAVHGRRLGRRRPCCARTTRRRARCVAEIALPGAVGGRPMTYMLDGKQYLVVSVAGANGAEIVALTL